ncbi:hypothetical protein BURMUCF1_B0423 [Burkholderia multivorans ATCC BAA-247]|nr:hypothetical protein BURMUCF1_B0423 [Burkholderia multivorans ATCC BAA-247]
MQVSTDKNTFVCGYYPNDTGNLGRAETCSKFMIRRRPRTDSFS